MIPISFGNFVEDNELLFLEIAFDKDSTLADVACEHYQHYLESIANLENE